MITHRKLTEKEIQQLIQQNCTSSNWNSIDVAIDFDPKSIANTSFSGKIKLGYFKKKVNFLGGLTKPSGIYNAIIHNCEIGNNSLINHVKNYIANYIIGENVIIENTELIAVEEKTSFGNGTKVDVMDETGGRQVIIYDNLSAHTAYFLTFYRHRPELVKNLEQLILKYSEDKKSDIGYIGSGTKIINTNQITNVRIGEQATISGCSRLNNGSVNSNKSAPVIIGADVKADNFIISSGSEVSDSTILTNTFVGQGCILSKHYSAVHSLFFANCQGFNGEACSVFAGPFTVTHHKSTLLIAGMFSFLNAGSGSNQSNHMYKLGPIHHGIVERGSKTTSDSYLLWPAKIGSFTLVMGRHYKNPDTSDMPFSYLIENKDDSWLVPGINLRSIGTIRDAMKWPKRDKRTDPNLMDSINYNLLSPYTIQRMINGQNKLVELKNISGLTTKTYTWGNTNITSKSLNRGIDLYEKAILKFLGNSIISRLYKCGKLTSIKEVRECLAPVNGEGKGTWIDLSGLIVPKSNIDKLITNIEKGQIKSLNEVENCFKELHSQYYDLEWNWAAHLLEQKIGKSINEITIDDLVEVLKLWIDSVIGLDEYLYHDAKKEFNLSSMTGFGIDGDHEIKKQDFEKVRGNFEENTFVNEILNHIKRKSDLGNKTIDLLNKIKE